jgi:hypothetical protein
MNIYILLEQVFEPCNESYINVLGAYKSKKDAETKQNETIQDNIKNFDFVLDEQSNTRIFQSYQENWDNYIEYKIIEKEVL